MKLQTQATDLPADPLAVFERLVDQHENCFLLETLADKYQPQTSSQSYIGVAPKHHFKAVGEALYVDGQRQATTQSYEALRTQMSFDPELPAGYIGGLVGYLSHEAVRYFEPSLTFPYARDFPDFEFGQYDDGLVFHPGQAPEYFSYGQDRVDLYKGQPPESQALDIEFVKPAKTEAQYSEMIESARQDIINGRAFQIVLANMYEYRFRGDLVNLYKEVRRINPSPFMFFIKFGTIVTMGASPEMLKHTKPNGDIFLEALAGTIRRGATPAEDATLADQLVHDEKEIAEHAMLVDLARNDAGRVCQIGSIKIDALMYIKKLSHVQHISSLVSGRLKPGCNAFDAVAATFPCGTMSGAPKVEAIKMISELEGYERGPYAGTIGYFSYNGDSMHATNLRSVSTVDDRMFQHSGSGVVYDSSSRGEFSEISYKKAAMDQAIKLFLREGQS